MGDQTSTPDPGARQERREWTTMTPEDFGQESPGTLFDLTPKQVPAPADGCGTGDLLEELD